MITDDQILSIVRPRFASEAEAISWFYESRLPGFDGKTARDLVNAGRGQEVLDYLEAVDAGTHA